MIKSYFHQARRSLAKFWLEVNPQLRIVGITGSFGKTNTARAVASVLSKKFPTVQTDLNLDTVYNLPITILKVKPWTEALVLEIGVDHPEEMDFHLSLVKPQVGIVTGITPVHSDKEHFGSLENIIKEKAKLLQSLPADGLAILNYEDEAVRKIADLTKAKVVFYGRNQDKKNNCDVWAEAVEVSRKGTRFTLREKNVRINVSTGLIGNHLVDGCLAAYLVGRYFQIEKNKIVSSFNELKPLKGRLNLESGSKGTYLLNDALRANPASTMAGLTVLAELKGKRKIAVLGEMGELGDFEEEGHRLVGRNLAKQKIDLAVGIGPLTKFILAEAIKEGMDKKKTFWAKDVVEAADFLKNELRKEDLVYLKGSLLRHLERILILLKEEKVDCRLVSCNRYLPCWTCPYRFNKVKSS